MRETFLNLIESKAIINDRFTNIARLDSLGGNGYFSLMFTAFDKQVKKDVVLKFFNPERSTDADRLSRFQREGEILLRLQGQPNILECIDGVCDLNIEVTAGSNTFPFKFQFIPLEKAIGSIESFTYSAGKDPVKCLLYFKEMCKSVARMHNQKLCHRDLKPSNFLLFPRGEVKVGDFGTSKFLDGSMPGIRSRYLAYVGDVNYCSPELVCSIGIGDERAFYSDLFALGAILFELFSEQVLTQYIYSGEQTVLNNLIKLGAHLSGIPEKEQTLYYSESIGSILSTRIFPDIFEFNGFVPKSIRIQLNKLYQGLTEPDFTKRLTDFNAIHRRIDICLLIMKNEMRYQQYIIRKKAVRRLRKIRGESDA